MIAPLKLRRATLSLLTLAATIALAFYYPRLETALPHVVFLSGWLLLGLCVFLTAYNARKKLPFIPLFSSRLWLQFHAYAGLFAGVLFVFHLGFSVPTGIFNLILAGLFLAVTFSGILGWWISRAIPRRLTSAGGEVPFDRIPVVRRELRLKAEKTVLAVIPEAKASTLADFYKRELAPSFAADPAFFSHIVASQTALNRQLTAITEVCRYLSPSEKAQAEALAELARARHILDFHHANQLLLKGWLFTHVPLTYGLLLFTGIHVILVHAFNGGAQ